MLSSPSGKGENNSRRHGTKPPSISDMPPAFARCTPIVPDGFFARICEREKKELERRTNMRKVWVKAWMTGRRFFTDGMPPTKLRLVESKTLSFGVLLLHTVVLLLKIRYAVPVPMAEPCIVSYRNR
jgi:hypothetical protein